MIFELPGMLTYTSTNHVLEMELKQLSSCGTSTSLCDDIQKQPFWHILGDVASPLPHQNSGNKITATIPSNNRKLGTLSGNFRELFV